jgi:hypothetical protein
VGDFLQPRAGARGSPGAPDAPPTVLAVDATGDAGDLAALQAALLEVRSWWGTHLVAVGGGDAVNDAGSWPSSTAEAHFLSSCGHATPLCMLTYTTLQPDVLLLRKHTGKTMRSTCLGRVVVVSCDFVLLEIVPGFCVGTKYVKLVVIYFF